ncbi:MAG: hypothetical protein KDA66_11395 [Planctomycetaceae bacterium]|nr:hypothetical protein [Planctomycetaceae bacterium]
MPLLLTLAAALPVAEESSSPFDAALSYQNPWVVRAQSPDASGGTVVSDPSMMTDPNGVTTFYQQTPMGTDPFAQSYPGPMTGDPWANGGVMPYATPNPAYGVNGPQPHQFGVKNSVDFGFLPSGSAKAPGAGGVNIFAVDIESRLTQPIGAAWIFQMAPQASYRSIEGPNSTLGATNLPGAAWRLGADFVLQSPSMGGWSFEYAFNPRLATDFDHMSGDAVMYDGRAVAYWTVGPRVTWVLGAQYWDRVDDIVVPYAGVIWTPNQLWEWQLVFPKPRVSVFLGTPMGVATWMYASAEYHVEAYELRDAVVGNARRVQFEDWRVMGGFRWDTGWVQSFVEAGYVFERNIEEQGGTKYGVGDGFIGRVGFRF